MRALARFAFFHPVRFGLVVIAAAACAIALAACGAGVMETTATNTAAGDVKTTIRTPSLHWPRPLAPKATRCTPTESSSCEDPTCPNGACAVPEK